MERWIQPWFSSTCWFISPGFPTAPDLSPERFSFLTVSFPLWSYPPESTWSQNIYFHLRSLCWMPLIYIIAYLTYSPTYLIDIAKLSEYIWTFDITLKIGSSPSLLFHQTEILLFIGQAKNLRVIFDSFFSHTQHSIWQQILVSLYSKYLQILSTCPYLTHCL